METTTAPWPRARGACCAAPESKREPAVLEAMTYRYRGHSVADAGLSYRTRDEIDAWKGKDPIALMRGRLVDHGVSDDELIALEREVAERVDAAVAYATGRRSAASRSWPPACMRPVAPSSSSACGRAARSASSNSSSTRAWADERHRRGEPR